MQTNPNSNLDPQVVAGFGDEWQRFDQSLLGGTEYQRLFNSYFHIFPWESLRADAQGFDLGCGSGRWARGVAPRVGKLYCIDPSADALRVAAKALSIFPNVVCELGDAGTIPLAEGSMDFGYCLGVLHHTPDPEAGILSAVGKLRMGAPFLLYLYHNLEDQPTWYLLLWKGTDAVRRRISHLPFALRYLSSQIIAASVYFPLAKLSRVLEWFGISSERIPLSYYRNCSFYTMRTDSLDRFGTKLESRISRAEMKSMMEKAGLGQIVFSETPPYWCAVGRRVR